jgi:FMN phosphatase YigB (HAD superfamily)
VPDLSLLKAVIFDLDGTLYRQGPLRRAMLFRLLRAYATRPLLGLRTVRVLAAYRNAQEHLRTAATADDLAEAQIQLACERTRADRPFVAECVERWMEREPLGFLKRFLRPGLVDFLQVCKAHGLRFGVLSDYPAEAKLQALGLAGVFDAVVCSRSLEIGFFKPHPLGLVTTLRRLGTRAAETLYVGDRPEVDAAAAQAAGMPCAILSHRPRAAGEVPWMEIAGFTHLHEALWRG